MRVKKLGVGVVLAAAIMLTGCSAGNTAEPEDSADSTSSDSTPSEAAEAPASDCPELVEGETIEGSVLGSCVTEALDGIAGYAATTSVMGLETTAKYNPAEKAIETTSQLGSLIVIGSDAWVKSGSGEWQVADVNSTDPIIAGLSAGADAASATDPAAIAAALSGEFTVTGTGERLGKTVYLVTGTVEQQGVSVDAVFELTADYENLATTTTAAVGEQSVEVNMVVTEWDVKQDIVAPL
jgi:hypothetical protein